MYKVWIETDKRQYLFSSPDIIMDAEEGISIIGRNHGIIFKPDMENKNCYKKFYDVDMETERNIYEYLKKITVDEKIIYQSNY